MKIGVGDLSDDMHTSLRKHCDSSEAMLLYAAVFVVIDEWRKFVRNVAKILENDVNDVTHLVKEMKCILPNDRNVTNGDILLFKLLGTLSNDDWENMIVTVIPRLSESKLMKTDTIEGALEYAYTLKSQKDALKWISIWEIERIRKQFNSDEPYESFTSHYIDAISEYFDNVSHNVIVDSYAE